MSSQMSSSPRRTLSERQAEKVERLFDAARDLLDEVGHEQMTVRMVASRAGVSAATAYTYFASKDHLFAELFWRLVDSSPVPELDGDPPERVGQVVTDLGRVIAGAPALAAAVNKSLLGSDPEVQRIRLAIGALFVDRFRRAIGPDAAPELIEALTCSVTGALLQAGMDVFGYEALPRVLGRVAGVVMAGYPPAAGRLARRRLR